MLDRLKQKWGVNSLNLFLILCTFALGGSLCGYLGRNILYLIGIQRGTFVYILLYIITLTLLWPLSVITVSLFLGQFSFFKNYLTKIKNRLLNKK